MPARVSLGFICIVMPFQGLLTGEALSTSRSVSLCASSNRDASKNGIRVLFTYSIPLEPVSHHALPPIQPGYQVLSNVGA